MSEQKNGFALPQILIGVNLFAFPNPEYSTFMDTLYHLLKKLRDEYKAYTCDIYTENDVESDYPFRVSAFRANIYGEALAFTENQITYPALESRIMDFLTQTIIQITSDIDQNTLPGIDQEQQQVLEQSIEKSKRIHSIQHQAESLSAAVDSDGHYYNKEKFYMGLENGLEMYCMDYTGEVKLRFGEQEQVHIIKESLALLYELRIGTVPLVEHSPQLKIEDKSEQEIQDFVDGIDPSNHPALYAHYERYLQKLKQLSKHLRTPDRFARIAIKDGIVLHHALHSL